MPLQNAVDAIKRIFDTVETKYPRYRGWLKAVNGSVHVSGKPGYVYIQRRDTSGGVQVEEMRMPDSSVPDVDGYPVIIGRDSISPGAEIVLRRDVDSYVDDLYTYLLRAHAEQHELPDGFDPVYVQGRAVVPLRVSPALTADTSVRVSAGWAPSLTGANQYFTGDEDVDLTDAIPTSGQRLVTISYDIETNSIVTTNGDIVAVNVPLTIDDIADSPSNAISLAAAHLYQDQTEITESHIWEMRSFIAGAADAQRQFVNLTDTPGTYIGQSGKVLIVNTEETALAFPSDQDLTYDGTDLEVTKLRGQTISTQPPRSGHVLQYSGSQWEPKTIQDANDVDRITPVTTPRWYIDGALSVQDEPGGIWWLMQGFRIDSVYIYTTDTGITGETTIDVQYSEDNSGTWTSVYTDLDNRPQITAGGAKVAIGELDIPLELEAGVMLRMTIEGVATDVENLTVQVNGQSGSAFGDNLTNLGVA